MQTDVINANELFVLNIDLLFAVHVVVNNKKTVIIDENIIYGQGHENRENGKKIFSFKIFLSKFSFQKFFLGT